MFIQPNHFDNFTVAITIVADLNLYMYSASVYFSNSFKIILTGQTSPIELGKHAEESTVEAVKVSHLRYLLVEIVILLCLYKHEYILMIMIVIVLSCQWEHH